MTRRNFLSALAVVPAVAMAPLDAFAPAEAVAAASPVELLAPFGVDFAWDSWERMFDMRTTAIAKKMDADFTALAADIEIQVHRYAFGKHPR